MSIQLGIWEGSNGGQLHSLEQETELSLSVPWRCIWGNQPPPPPHPRSIPERYILSSEKDELHLLQLDLSEHKP